MTDQASPAPAPAKNIDDIQVSWNFPPLVDLPATWARQLAEPTWPVMPFIVRPVKAEVVVNFLGLDVRLEPVLRGLLRQMLAALEGISLEAHPEELLERLRSACIPIERWGDVAFPPEVVAIMPPEVKQAHDLLVRQKPRGVGGLLPDPKRGLWQHHGNDRHYYYVLGAGVNRTTGVREVAYVALYPSDDGEWLHFRTLEAWWERVEGVQRFAPVEVAPALVNRVWADFERLFDGLERMIWRKPDPAAGPAA